MKDASGVGAKKDERTLAIVYFTVDVTRDIGVATEILGPEGCPMILTVTKR